MPHIKHPNPWVQHYRDKSPKCVALKTNGGFVEENHRTIGNRKPMFKRITYDSLPLGPSTKASSWKTAGWEGKEICLLIFNVCQRGRNLGISPLRTETQLGAIFAVLLYLACAGTEQGPFWLSPTLSAMLQPRRSRTWWAPCPLYAAVVLELAKWALPTWVGDAPSMPGSGAGGEGVPWTIWIPWTIFYTRQLLHDWER